MRLARVPITDVLSELERQTGASVRGSLLDPREVTAEFKAVPLLAGAGAPPRRPELRARVRRGGAAACGDAAPGGAGRRPARARRRSRRRRPAAPDVITLEEFAQIIDSQPPVPLRRSRSARCSGPRGDLPPAAGRRRCTTRMPACACRRSASRSAAIEGQPELRAKLVSAPRRRRRGRPLSQLIESAAGDRAQEFASNVTAQTRATEVRAKSRPRSTTSDSRGAIAGAAGAAITPTACIARRRRCAPSGSSRTGASRRRARRSRGSRRAPGRRPPRARRGPGLAIGVGGRPGIVYVLCERAAPQVGARDAAIAVRRGRRARSGPTAAACRGAAGSRRPRRRAAARPAPRSPPRPARRASPPGARVSPRLAARRANSAPLTSRKRLDHRPQDALRRCRRAGKRTCPGRGSPRARPRAGSRRRGTPDRRAGSGSSPPSRSPALASSADDLAHRQALGNGDRVRRVGLAGEAREKLERRVRAS